jgi:hypothetical protein
VPPARTYDIGKAISLTVRIARMKNPIWEFSAKSGQLRDIRVTKFIELERARTRLAEPTKPSAA